MKEWNPPKFIANCCNSLIWSKYPGQYCQCECGKAFVDQTEYYGRSSGDITIAPLSAALQEEVEEEENEDR